MKRVLKDESAIRDFWLEPSSRKVISRRIAVTDLKGRVLDWMPRAFGGRAEVKFTPLRRNALLIDFGMEVGGFPRLAFEASSAARIGVQAVESIEHIVTPVLARPLSHMDQSVKDIHLKVMGKEVKKLPHWGGFRYLWLYPLKPCSVALRDAWVEYTPHIPDSIDSTGYFLSSDDLLNRAWYAGLHTIEMCTVDPALGGHNSRYKIGEGNWVFIDGAKRDRLIWTGDLSPIGVAVYVSVNNTEAMRDSLYSLSCHQRKDGYIPACSPTAPLGRIVNGRFGDYVAWWIVTLYQYYLHTGDMESLKDFYPRMKRALIYLHSQTRGGLFRQTPLNMMEWCFSIYRFGKPSYTNVLYYWALNCASFLAHEMEDEDLSTGCVSRAYRLGEAIFRNLWDSEKGVFIDSTTNRKRVPQDANVLAIISGLVGEKPDVSRMLNYLREKMWVEWGSTNVDIPYYRYMGTTLLPHNKKVVPFMNNFEALARFMSYDDSGAMELIRRCWGNMVDREPGTSFWEWVGEGGRVDRHTTSLCHGWSAGVVPLLSKFVLGVRPADVGYRRFTFDPRCEGLEWVEGRIPTPRGFIEARVERVNGEYRKYYRAPSGLELVS